MKIFRIALPEETHHKLKIEAAVLGTTMQDMVLALIEQALSKSKSDVRKDKKEK